MSEPQVAPAATSVTVTAFCVALLDANDRIEWASPGLHELPDPPAMMQPGNRLGELARESVCRLAGT